MYLIFNTQVVEWLITFANIISPGDEDDVDQLSLLNGIMIVGSLTEFNYANFTDDEQ